MKAIKWALLAAGGLFAAAIVGFGLLTGGGTARADDGPDSPGAGARYEDALAAKLGISGEQLKGVQRAALGEMADAAVATGKITRDQAARLKDVATKPDGEAGQKRLHGRVKDAVSNLLDAAAKAIGVSKKDLKSDLKSGKSLAQVAAVHNVSRDQLKSGIAADIQAKLRAAVANGKLTQQQADRISTGLDKHLDKVIDRAAPDRVKASKAPGTK